ncbi:MAG TPA: hypothetical protein VFW45_00040, partial [Candidatus Polarisedimenticolia bacterium]|nr:hypothetical protein [Candidatus Polarisedimenticolia bacterium]
VPGYAFEAASSLFLIDRKGYLAGVPSEFYFKFGEELERRLPDLLAGRPTPGPVLWSAERLPQGWGEIWRDRDIAGVASMAVAPATSRGPLEIGVLDGDHHLLRFSHEGARLGESSLDDGGESWWGLQAADLDGDGTNEWLVRAGRSEMTVIDSEGRPYWSYYGRGSDETAFDLAGVTDLDGDRFKEIVVRSGNTVTALRNVNQPQWEHRSKESLIYATVDARGAIWEQSARGLFPIDALGHAGPVAAPAMGSMLLKGEVQGSNGKPLKIFGSRYVPFVDADHDLDGDGRQDIVIVSQGGGISAYDSSGRTILSLWIAENQSIPRVALANLDGQPGDEMVLFIPQYGLVALGRGGGQVAAK